MSAGFKRRVADELNAPLDLVTAHFSAEAQIDRRQFYKAEEKPEVSRKTSFEEAVRNSGLTEEQQRFLLTL
jgi:1,4-alpha-glucan branching enzyme